MFEKCSIMVIAADDSTLIYRFEVDAETQESICASFSSSVNELVSGKEKVEFDGKYKPEQDEFLCINKFLRL